MKYRKKIKVLLLLEIIFILIILFKLLSTIFILSLLFNNHHCIINKHEKHSFLLLSPNILHLPL